MADLDTTSTPADRDRPGRSILTAIRECFGENRDRYIIVLLVVLSCAVRIYSLQFFRVISTDGTSYVGAAAALAKGDPGGIGIYGFYPVLILLAGQLFSDPELAGRVVSILFGSLLVVPLYLFGRGVFPRRAAFYASLLVAVWPSLVASSCEVMTQATFDFLQMSGIYLVWRMFRHPSARSGLLAGLCTALAYFTRPEGVLLFLLPPLPFLVYYRRQLGERRTMLAAYVAGFSLIFAVNLLLVHHVTGKWQLSAKTDSALNDALSYYLNIPDLIYLPGYVPKGYLDILREHPMFVVTNTLKNLRLLFVTTLPAWFWGLAGIGFCTGGFRGERAVIRQFLLASLVPLVVLVVFYYISPGYTEAYLPVFLLWGALGLCFLEGKLAERLAGGTEGWRIRAARLPLGGALVFLYALAVFSSQVRENVPDSAYTSSMDNCRLAEKFLGLALKENLPPGKIMTRWARIAFYADREWVNIPAGVDLAGVLNVARESGARFLVADCMLYGNRPALGPEIFDPLAERPYGKYFMTDPDLRIMGLKPVFLYTDPRDFGVVVYEVPQSHG